MKKLLDPGYWARALRSPVVLAGLAVDLAPIYAVIVWGWGAAPLVVLYWIENLIIGAMTIPRIVISGATFGGVGILLGLAMSAFFVFHYGLFCAVHGTFLFAFMSMSSGPDLIDNAVIMDMPAMAMAGLGLGLNMAWLAGLSVAWQVFLFLREFVFKGGWKDTNPMAEMFAPYSRIVVLHFAIFAGAGALVLLGEPMIGVLGLIVLRAAFGVTNNAALDGLDPARTVPPMTRERFEKLMKGKADEA